MAKESWGGSSQNGEGLIVFCSVLTSHSICPKLIDEVNYLLNLAPGSFPELPKRGLLDAVLPSSGGRKLGPLYESTGPDRQAPAQKPPYYRQSLAASEIAWGPTPPGPGVWNPPPAYGLATGSVL